MATENKPSGLGAATLGAQGPVSQKPPAPDAFVEEEPRARAARRAAELLGHVENFGVEDDKFYIDPRIIPDGWTYEYRMHTVLGKQDPSYQVTLARAGWEAVPRKRHPEMMPVGWVGPIIEKDGMILMERPSEITERMKALELRRAREQVGDKEAQLYGSPAGPNSPFNPDNKGKRMVKLGKSYEMPIPDK